jgi:hypothetical protein
MTVIETLMKFMKRWYLQEGSDTNDMWWYMKIKQAPNWEIFVPIPYQSSKSNQLSIGYLVWGMMLMW